MVYPDTEVSIWLRKLLSVILYILLYHTLVEAILVYR